MKLQAQEIEALTEKYTGRVPRYTSYPTAVEFKPTLTHEAWQQSLETDLEKFGPDTSLYVHIPFCKTLCFFCACAREGGKDRDRVRPYLQALEKEIAAYATFGERCSITQLHFGGGSPNYLTSEELIEVVGYLKKSFPHWSSNAELSAELDPRETTSAQIETLRGLGFSRFSFGVQDFDLTVQQAINRKQSLDATAALVAESRRIGINEINFDLIYGLPEQTLEGWRETLKTTIMLKPNRLAIYGYAHVDWRSKTQKAFNESYRLPTPQERIALFVLAHQMLTEAGYYYLGLDHFALENDSLTRAHKNGSMRRNFMGYSTLAGTRVLGFGASAISSTQQSFAQNEISVDAYQQKISESGHALTKGMLLTEDDKIRREMIETLMCTCGIDLAAYQDKFSHALEIEMPDLQQNIEKLVSDGLITRTGTRIDATLKGRVLLRSIACIFDAYLPKYQAGAKVFSAAV